MQLRFRSSSYIYLNLPKPGSNPEFFPVSESDAPCSLSPLTVLQRVPDHALSKPHVLAAYFRGRLFPGSGSRERRKSDRSAEAELSCSATLAPALNHTRVCHYVRVQASPASSGPLRAGAPVGVWAPLNSGKRDLFGGSRQPSTPSWKNFTRELMQLKYFSFKRPAKTRPAERTKGSVRVCVWRTANYCLFFLINVRPLQMHTVQDLRHLISLRSLSGSRTPCTALHSTPLLILSFD